VYVQDTEEAERVSEHYEDLRYAEPDLVCTSLSAVAGVYTPHDALAYARWTHTEINTGPRPRSSVERRLLQVLSTDRRRSLVYHTECPPLSNEVGDTLRRSTRRGEFFEVPGSGQSSRDIRGTQLSL